MHDIFCLEMSFLLSMNFFFLPPKPLWSCSEQSMDSNRAQLPPASAQSPKM